MFRSYLYPMMDRPNLTVVTNAFVTEIVIEVQELTGLTIASRDDWGSTPRVRRIYFAGQPKETQQQGPVDLVVVRFGEASNGAATLAIPLAAYLVPGTEPSACDRYRDTVR